VKKFVIGCLAVLVLGAIGVAVAGYFLYRAASPMIQDARNYLEGMAELSELDKQIKNTAAYTAPANRELTEDQVKRFARVQDSVRASLGHRVAEIEKEYEHLRKMSGSEQPSIGEVLSALKDLGSLFVQTRRFQVDALNQEGFSQAEYSWVHDRVYEAAGLEVANTIDFKKMEEALRKGSGLDTTKAPQLPAFEVPENNRALIKPYMSRMDEWIPLAFFGL